MRFVCTEINCQDEHYHRTSSENYSIRLFFINTILTSWLVYFENLHVSETIVFDY